MLRKLLVFGLAAVLVCLGLIVGAWAYIAGTTDSRITASVDAVEPAEAGLVLGTARLIHGRFLNPFFSSRIAAATDLYASGKVKYLIVSGNREDSGPYAGIYDEAADMKDALVMAGVPAEKIYRDDAGFRTLDSVLRAKSVFGQDKVVVVSQRFHLERALFLAEAHGLNFQGFAAKDPTQMPLQHVTLREAFARPWAVLDVLIGRAPRIAGKAVALGIDPAR
ncbi:SanA/YdcF family protein [Methylovirgula sp. 4M-Z18]|uniref:SanA/YdcF family protein n=1 Tax=Methylovirgula sp. 4M-Z18 TaxID=2293567 RepID=UPI001314C325|nr:ElyC/SanA/YdcF family protein [Methylovirgula sp. 4M-Z18]